MKKNTLVALGLVSMISLGMAAGTVKAAGGTAKTTGKVGFTNVEFPKPTIPPDEGGDNGGEGTPEGGTNEAGDENLKIQYVTNFDFGNKDDGTLDDENTYDAGKGATLNAFPAKYTGGKTGPLGISIANSGKIKEWKLSVAASPFTGNDKEIKGMAMTLNSLIVNNTPALGTVKATVKDGSIDLGAAQVIASYENTGDDEMSVNNIAFGAFSSGEDRYAGVTLEVPAAAPIEKDVTYTSNITWTLAGDAI